MREIGVANFRTKSRMAEKEQVRYTGTCLCAFSFTCRHCIYKPDGLIRHHGCVDTTHNCVDTFSPENSCYFISTLRVR